jgi:UrcA family protein
MTAATCKANSNLSTSRLLTALAACLLGGALSAAHAASPADGVPTMVVSYGDLNLSTDDGARTLYRRIAAAARQVCPLEDPRDLVGTAHSNACRTQAVARAVRDINSPRVAALHAEHSNRG